MKRFIGAAVALAAVLAVVAIPAPAHAAYVPISGAGSTWSSNAIDQWRANVRQNGLVVNYSATGSSDGRNQYRNGTVDFGVSEIPYGLAEQGVIDPPPARKFAYMPIVAGGTSFMYNLKIGTKRVTNLRLSGEVLTKIFTGKITSWADPEIAAHNPGLSLPARRIVPVVRSDGSGTTAQLTKWMSTDFAGLWNEYCGRAGRATPCGMTSFFPVVPGSGFVAQAGSNSVAGYVAQSASEGAITYVEYSYARAAGFPVVKMLNAADYYVLPTAENVAVALMTAQINPGDLTQKLEGVYHSRDKRAYPLSSYSYMIIPTQAEGTFNEAKGFSLGVFAYYFLCQGQQPMKALGYSPLPINLVQEGLKQVARIPGVHTQDIDIKNCNNPTFSTSGKNTLALNAPNPSECDHRGVTNCSGGGPTNPQPNGSLSPGASPGPGVIGNGPGTNGTGNGGTGAIDPDTGLPVQNGGNGGDADLVAGVPVELPAQGVTLSQILMFLAAIMLLGLILGPPMLARLFRGAGRR